jgi:hypothetical protein
VLARTIPTWPDIEECARWTVVENDKEGPVIKRWEPFPEHLQPDAVPRGRVLAPAAEFDRGQSGPPPGVARVPTS